MEASPLHLENFRPCGYIPGLRARFLYFYSYQLGGKELEHFLALGWRKFNYVYFRPYCGPCSRCIPIRILAREFTASKSQRRLLRKNSQIQVKFGPLSFSEKVYQVYREHSLARFQQDTTVEEFFQTHYFASCPVLQSEYYLGDELIAVGFLDRSSRALSSSYFVYRPSYSHLSLGIYSVLAETQFAASLGLDYYYLGYYIAKNHHMAYKNRFYPYEIFEWDNWSWKRCDKQSPLFTPTETHLSTTPD